MDAAGSYAGGVILALDAATHTGVCEGAPGETPKLEVVNFGSRKHFFGAHDHFDIWGGVQMWMERRIEENADTRAIELVVIEGLVPQYTPERSSPWAAAATGDKTLQAGIYATFGAVARNKRIPVLSAPIQSWRAFVFGDGKLKKPDAKARAKLLTRKLGWNPQDDNAAEAGCIWLWACSQVAPKKAHRFEPLFLGRGAA